MWRWPGRCMHRPADSCMHESDQGRACATLPPGACARWNSTICLTGWVGTTHVPRALLHDVDDALHAELGVAAPVLGVHEAQLHIDTRLGRDRLLLEGFVGNRPDETDGRASYDLFKCLLLVGKQILDGLLGGLHVLERRRRVHVHEV